jgi:pyridoxine 5'-phosphate synthase PdxJ
MASSKDLPDVDQLTQLCEKIGAALLVTAGVLRERKRHAQTDDWESIEAEWELIEGSAHDLLKALAL